MTEKYNATTNVLPYISTKLNELKGSNKKIGDFLLTSSGNIVNLTADELAERAEVSEASVIRFCQKLGFKGFKDFKIKLAQDMGNGATAQKAVPSEIDRGDDTWEVVKKIMFIEQEDIKFTMDMLDEQAVRTALDYITKSNKLAFFGVGSSSLVAANAKEHFLHYGKSAMAESEGLSQIILANTLTETDVAFAISISGKSQVPIRALEVAKRNGAKTICLTQDSHSPLAKVSDCVILAFRKSSSLDDLGTATRIVHIAVIDAISVAYATGDWDRIAAIARANRTNFREYTYGR